MEEWASEGELKGILVTAYRTAWHWSGGRRAVQDPQ